MSTTIPQFRERVTIGDAEGNPVEYYTLIPGRDKYEKGDLFVLRDGTAVPIAAATIGASVNASCAVRVADAFRSCVYCGHPVKRADRVAIGEGVYAHKHHAKTMATRMRSTAEADGEDG